MDFVRPPRDVNVSLVAGRGHYLSVVQAVLAAERSVWIATANLKELMVEDPRVRPGKRRSARAGSFRSVIEVFAELSRRGVELRILHAGPPSRAFREELARHPELLAGGLRSRQCPRVHLKAVIVDAAQLYLGSANWTGAGLGAKGEGRRNFEIGLVTSDELWIDELQAMYDGLWEGGACASCKLRELCPAPLDGPAAERASLVTLGSPRRATPLPPQRTGVRRVRAQASSARPVRRS